jgi:transposase
VPRAARVKGGRPAFDHVLMFKTLILQANHNLSDERTEYLIRDRLSFMRFLGLGLADTVPDPNTIWTFREALTRAKISGQRAIEVVFERFDAALAAAGFLAMSGQIIDCLDRRRAQAAQYRWREARHQRRPHAGSVGRPAGQAAAEGPRCALDGQIHQS